MEDRLWSRNACRVVGGLLVLESLAILQVLAFMTILIGGAAGAANVHGGGATRLFVNVVALYLSLPVLVAVAVFLAGVLLVLRRGRGLIIAAGVFAAAVQVFSHVFLDGGIHVGEFVPFAANVAAFTLHLATIFLGFAYVPRRAKADAAA